MTCRIFTVRADATGLRQVGPRCTEHRLPPNCSDSSYRAISPRHGISTTAGMLTSAAVVMVGVFAVFITLSFLDFKELGLGMAAAILIGATIIRGVLLPASMTVLGDWNWYLPKWPEWLPQVGQQRGAAPPAESKEASIPVGKP
jgi:uncharacterized membrane protein YdfJ with MMPL/SSD domain